jgi:transposase
MRWRGRRVTVYAHTAPTDMRKGFDSLGALVSERLGGHPTSGDVFLLLSRDRIRAKVLHFDGTGLCLYIKRLERGRFASIWRDAGAAPLTLTVSELDLFRDGSALVRRVALTPPPLVHFSLASDRAG